MIKGILIFIFLLVSLFSFSFFIIVDYHFKRFAPVEFPEAKKILIAFKTGSIFFFILNLLFLILIFLK